MKEKDTVTLDHCLRAFSREELLTGSDQWYCNKCKEQRDIHKKLELYRLPKILIIQLKRFQSKKSASKGSSYMSLAYAQVLQEKVGDFVDFPTEGLDLRDYVEDIRIKESPDPVLYDLYAVSNHYGSLHGGHYTAYGYN
jgi:ubiquitin C-terminal hydrolase